MRRHATAPGRSTACASHAAAGPIGGRALRGNVEEVPQLATYELGGDLGEVPTAARCLVAAIMSVIVVVIVMVATAAATRQYATASTAAAPTRPRTAASAAKAKRLSRRGLRCCSRYARGRESRGNGYRGGHGGHTARWRKGASTLARLRDAGAGTAHAAAALLVPRVDRGVAKEFGGAVVGRRVAPPCGLARTCRPPLALHVRRRKNLYSKIRQHRSLQI